MISAILLLHFPIATIGHSLLVFLHYMYAPVGHPWWMGNVWGNFFIGFILVPLAWIWSKTKFFPLRPLQKAFEPLHTKLDSLHERHDKHEQDLDALYQRVEDLHNKHDDLLSQVATLKALQDHHGTLLTAIHGQVVDPEPPSPSKTRKGQDLLDRLKRFSSGDES